MRTTWLLALGALLAACGDDTNDEAKHAYVTCGSSWAANGVNITKCEAACENYIDEANSDTCDGTKWDHATQEPNTMPDGLSGCAGVVVIDGIRGCCVDENTEIDFVVCDIGM